MFVYINMTPFRFLGHRYTYKQSYKLCIMYIEISASYNYWFIVFSLRAQGKNPYVLEPGGANATGCWGYIEAFNEMIKQVLIQIFYHYSTVQYSIIN